MHSSSSAYPCGGLFLRNVQVALSMHNRLWKRIEFVYIADRNIMKHIETIKAFIKTLMNSDSFHALIVNSLPGWGKSTTIDLALSELGIKAVIVGSYATPLHIYNTFCQNPHSVIVLDDCACLFSDSKTMAILKAATWQSSGSNPSAGVSIRRIAWGSTSDKVEHPFVDFSGKVIVLTNVVPSGKETEAFLSRCLSYRISLNKENVKEMLLSAANSAGYFPKPVLAQEVVRFLVSQPTTIDLMKMNLRTIKMGYDLAETHPEMWRELLVHLLPRSGEPTSIAEEILKSDIPVKAQVEQFLASTGKSRRSFYNLKKQLGLTRKYQSRVTK